jgi:hypothetical protein
VTDNEADRRETAQDAILDKISALIAEGGSSLAVLYLAEAWAWLSVPNQSHGGGSPKSA